MGNDKDQQRRLVGFLIVSLLLHWFVLWFIPRIPEQKPPPELAALDVELIKQAKRIADILPPKKQLRPKKADFLGIYDSTVKEEQVARSTESQLPKPEMKQEQKSLASRYAMKKEQSQKKAQSKSEAARRAGQLPEDFYPDYKIGAHTYLNVLRFPQIQYFVRLKRIFKMTFNPSPVLRPYVFANQITRGQVEVVLGVTIDASGQLARLFVINGSGFRDYDNEALRTVRDSSPFAHPPGELLGKDRTLRMSWTFTVYL